MAGLSSSFSPGMCTPARPTPLRKRAARPPQKPSAKTKASDATAPMTDATAQTRRPSMRSVRPDMKGTAAA